MFKPIDYEETEAKYVVPRCVDCVLGGDVCEAHLHAKICIDKYNDKPSGGNCPHWKNGCGFLHTVEDHLVMNQVKRKGMFVPGCSKCTKTMCNECYSDPSLVSCEDVTRMYGEGSCGGSECVYYHPVADAAKFRAPKVTKILVKKSPGLVPSCTECISRKSLCVVHGSIPMCPGNSGCHQKFTCKFAHVIWDINTWSKPDVSSPTPNVTTPAITSATSAASSATSSAASSATSSAASSATPSPPASSLTSQSPPVTPRPPRDTKSKTDVVDELIMEITRLQAQVVSLLAANAKLKQELENKH